MTNEQQGNARMQAIKQAAMAARRRAELLRWQERRERLLAVRPRSDDERLAQKQALELLERARLG